MFVLLLTYTRSLDDVDALRDEHGGYLERHFATGRFLAAGPRVPRTGSVILAAGDDEDLISSIIREDPLLGRGVATYEVIRFDARRSGSANVLTHAFEHVS
jgi:uncharacterized protein YciI